MVIGNHTTSYQTSKLNIPYNVETSSFDAPSIQQLDEHGVHQQEFLQTLNAVAEKITKVRKTKTCCSFSICGCSTFVSMLLLGLKHFSFLKLR
jgi:hypothetical protein